MGGGANPRHHEIKGRECMYRCVCVCVFVFSADFCFSLLLHSINSDRFVNNINNALINRDSLYACLPACLHGSGNLKTPNASVPLWPASIPRRSLPKSPQQ